MIIYAVEFNDCIYESAFHVISLHRTKNGAVKAMIKFKSETFNSWMYSEFVAFRFNKFRVEL